MSSKVNLGILTTQYQLKYNLPKRGDGKVSTYKYFSEILESKNLVSSLLESNTFFHAKLGFYEKIYDALVASSTHHKIVHTSEQFPITSSFDRLIVVPRTASSGELNSLVAKALNTEIPIWVIAPFSLMSPSILINFRNFFITFHKKSELEEMLSVFDFSLASENFTWWVEEKLQKWQDFDSVAVFITNHPSFLSEKDNIALFELRL